MMLAAAGISDATCCVFAALILLAFWIGLVFRSSPRERSNRVDPRSSFHD
jgi:hypothetical protein